MAVSFLPIGPVVLAWFAAALFFARSVYRRQGDAPPAERAMFAVAFALIGFAPVVWFLVASRRSSSCSLPSRGGRGAQKTP